MATGKTAPKTAKASATRPATPRKTGALAEPLATRAPGSNAKTAETTKAKHKLVRDSFTIPKNEYLVLTELKQRAERLMRPAKKGELLRAGIGALAAMSDAAFLAAMRKVPSLKTGRPKDEKAAPANAAAKPAAKKL